MKNIFSPGDTREFRKIVGERDIAEFDAGMVHAFYSTFALGRDAEWACRLFVLEMKDTDEEGIGNFLSVFHKSPALVGEEVVFTATVDKIINHEIICKFEARVAERLIAHGEQGQKILKKEKINRLMENLTQNQTGNKSK